MEDYKKAKLLRWFGIDREKKKANGWQAFKEREMTFDIEIPGHKRQMTDIAAAMGIGGLEDYDSIIEHRKNLFDIYKTINVESYLEIIGVTGGIIKIFQVINNSIGRIMLKILKSCVKKENSRFKQEQRERINSIVSLKHVESLDNIKTLELTDIDSKIISK